MFRPFRLRLDSRCQADIAQIRSGLDAGLTLQYVYVARSRASADTDALMRMAPSLRENRADKHARARPGTFCASEPYNVFSLWRPGKRAQHHSSTHGPLVRVDLCRS